MHPGISTTTSFRGFQANVSRKFSFRAPLAYIRIDAFYISACTCPGQDHPGPDTSKGRGVPEIDIFEAERNKTTDSVGQVVSQSAQFAPFTHDYLYNNATPDAFTVYDPTITRPNDYRGSAVYVS